MDKQTGMNNVEVMELVNSLEKRYPVHTWHSGGIDFWPLIRRTIFNHLRKKKITTVKDTSKKSILPKAPLLLGSYLRSFFLSKSSFIFSGNIAHRVDFKAYSYNRFADPLMDQLQIDGNNSLLIETTKTSFLPKGVYRKDRYFLIENAIQWLNLVLRFRKKLVQVKPSDFTEYSCFLQELIDLDSGFKKKLSTKKLDVIVARMSLYKKFATMLLKRVKPRAVLALSYYGEWNLSLLAAAHSLKIPTFDIQHALMYPKQCAYNNFVNIPKGGYNSMPDYFWTWGDYEAELVNEWAGKTSRHKALPWGNPWINAYRSGQTPYKGSIDSYLDPKKELILYTLGNRGEQFPEYLVNFIKTNNDSYQFWFRMHPRQIQFKNDIERQLKEFGIDNLVNLEEASSLPLPEILNHSNVHISLMSSVVIEAAYFGVHSLVLHADGKVYFENHRVKSFCHFFDERNENILECIKQLSRARNTSSPPVLISNLSRNLIKHLNK